MTTPLHLMTPEVKTIFTKSLPEFGMVRVYLFMHDDVMVYLLYDAASGVTINNNAMPPSYHTKSLYKELSEDPTVSMFTQQPR